MSAPFFSSRFEVGKRLFERASNVIPGGIYGHVAPAAAVPGTTPYFAAHGEGCRYWDVDGNEYIDFMCGYGPIVLGYNHPKVEEAAERQRAAGNCFNHPTEATVQLAEMLVDRVDFADWAVFGKNGSDMTTWAVQVAREHTRSKKILKIAGSYHGTHAWCTPGHGGLIEEDRTHIHTFPWNDLDAFDALMKKHRNQVAAVILTPYHHPTFAEQEMPAPGFLSEIEQIARAAGTIVILDDVRAGFRLHRGGSHRLFGFTPDLICFCKALGNGHPIAATLGADFLKKAAGAVFLTGSYWNSAVPMAASIACLNELEACDGIAKMEEMGRRLSAGLEQKALEHGHRIRFTGPPAIPFMTFDNDKTFRKAQKFSGEAAARGLFMHPHHNWFLSVAHTPEWIDLAVARAGETFAAM